jgi:N4-gp56 family major capsid protein
MPTIQNWTTSADGGFLSNPVLSKQLRMVAAPQCKFRQFVRPVPDFGKQKGDTVPFDKVGKVLTSGSTLSELVPIPKTKIPIYRDTLVVTEYGNSVDYTGKLEALSEFDPNNIIQQALRDDMATVLDIAAATQFRTTDIIYTPSGTSAAPTGTWAYDGTCITAATRNGQVADIKNIIDKMMTLNVPAYDGEDYMCVASIQWLRGIMDDPEWQDAMHYGDPTRIFSGEVGRMYKCRFVRETNTLSNAMTANCGEAIFFGADPVVEGIAVPEEIRAKIPTDYGRDKGVAWYSILGFKLTWDYSVEGETHVVRVFST